MLLPPIGPGRSAVVRSVVAAGSGTLGSSVVAVAFGGTLLPEAVVAL